MTIVEELKTEVEEAATAVGQGDTVDVLTFARLNLLIMDLAALNGWSPAEFSISTVLEQSRQEKTSKNSYPLYTGQDIGDVI